MAKPKNLNDLRKHILNDKSIRRAVVRRSFYWFFVVFLSHYIQYEVALFQREMFELLEDTRHRLTVIMAFRGSGKSTIMNLGYVLWSILGEQQKRFILIISKTQNQSKGHFLNIRDELKNNPLLVKDLGPFEVDDSWGMSSLVLTRTGTRITVASREQSIRGTRFLQHRPDVIICDDLEDSTAGSAREYEETYRWFMSEVMPAGDRKTKIIVLGNLLGESSLLMRLRDDIARNKVDGVFRAYPLIDDLGQVLWPGKFDSAEALLELERSIPDREIYEREYLLRYVPEKFISTLDRLTRENESNDHIHQLGPYQINAPMMTFGLADFVRDRERELATRDPDV